MTTLDLSPTWNCSCPVCREKFEHVDKVMSAAKLCSHMDNEHILERLSFPEYLSMTRLTSPGLQVRP